MEVGQILHDLAFENPFMLPQKSQKESELIV